MKLLISDYSGGLHDPGSLRVADNELVELCGFDHRGGAGLRLFSQHLALTKHALYNSKVITGTDATPFINIAEHVGPSNERFHIARRDQSIWVGRYDSWRRVINGEKILIYNEEADKIRDYASPQGSAINITTNNTTTAKHWSGLFRRFAGNSGLQTDYTVSSSATALSVSAWVKLRALPSNNWSYAAIAAGWNSIAGVGWIFNVRQDGKLSVYMAKNDGGSIVSRYVITSSSIGVGSWHHLAFTYTEGANPKIFIDSVQQSVTVGGSGAAGTYLATTSMVVLGGLYFTGGAAEAGLNGDMGYFSLWEYDISTGTTLQNQYNNENPRYSDAQLDNDPVSWYPLFGEVCTLTGAAGTTAKKLVYTRRSGKGPESFCSVGHYLYFSPDTPGPTDYIMRWSGEILYAGTYAGLTAGYFDKLLPGDTVYKATLNASSSPVWQELGGYTWFHNGALSGDDPNSAAAGVYYVVVRVHRVGVPAATSCTAAISATAGTLSGSYKYLWRYKCSSTSITGTISTISASVTANNQGIDVSGWTKATDANHNDQIVGDQVEIFRSYGDEPFYLVATVSAWSVSSWTDTGVTADANTPLDDDAGYHTRPGAIGCLVNFRNRFYGYEQENPHRLKFSTLDGVEYWPSKQYASLTGSNVLLGGYAAVGANTSESIIVITTESGSYSTTGREGSNLLVMLSNNRTCRWFGWTGDDFSIADAWPAAAISQRLAINYCGTIAFISPDDLMSVPSGGDQPQSAGFRVWPRGLRESFSYNALKSWRLCSWNGWWLILDTTTQRIWMFDAQRQTWTSDTPMRLSDGSQYTYNDIFVSARDNCVYAAATLNGNTELHKLWSSSAGYRNFAIATGQLKLEADQTELDASKRVTAVNICCRIPAAYINATSLNMELYLALLNSDTGSEAVIGSYVDIDKNTIADSTSTYAWRVCRWVFDEQSQAYQFPRIRIYSDKALPGFGIEWMQVEAQVSGRGPKPYVEAVA